MSIDEKLSGSGDDENNVEILHGLVRVTALNIEAAVALLKKRFDGKTVRGLAVSWFSGQQLTFLYSVPFIEELKLDTDNFAGKLDLSCLPALKDLVLTYSDNIDGLQTLEQLERLVVFRVKTANKDLAGVLPGNIRDLAIRQSPLESLSGLEELKRLEKCELSYLPKLQDVSALAALKDSLKFLDIQNAKRITNHHTLGALENLDELCILQCKSMPSIGWLRSLKRLRRFVFMDTRIEDGDLSPLLDLPNLEDAPGGYLKHYRPSMKEVEATLKQRQMQKR